MTDIVVELEAQPDITITLDVGTEPRRYTHDQSSPATRWIVSHNLDRIPTAAYVVDSAGTQHHPVWIDVSTTSLTLVFDAGACSGTAYIA